MAKKEKWYPGKYAKKAKAAVSESISRRRLKKLAKKGAVQTAKGTQVKEASYSKKAQARKKKAYPGMEKTGKVSRGAVGAVATKGGTYTKYKKDSKAAGDFRSKFKSSCAGGAKSFTWQGRSYSCAKK
tara:strand:- start:130 stop:513 length:384 start_codon:yes stop_codon:yes gene_type:complete